MTERDSGNPISVELLLVFGQPNPTVASAAEAGRSVAEET
jgi:hypothetical protein